MNDAHDNEQADREIHRRLLVIAPEPSRRLRTQRDAVRSLAQHLIGFIRASEFEELFTELEGREGTPAEYVRADFAIEEIITLLQRKAGLR